MKIFSLFTAWNRFFLFFISNIVGSTGTTLEHVSLCIFAAPWSSKNDYKSQMSKIHYMNYIARTKYHSASFFYIFTWRIYVTSLGEEGESVGWGGGEGGGILYEPVEWYFGVLLTQVDSAPKNIKNYLKRQSDVTIYKKTGSGKKRNDERKWDVQH